MRTWHIENVKVKKWPSWWSQTPMWNAQIFGKWVAIYGIMYLSSMPSKDCHLTGIVQRRWLMQPTCAIKGCSQKDQSISARMRSLIAEVCPYVNLTWQLRLPIQLKTGQGTAKHLAKSSASWAVTALTWVWSRVVLGQIVLRTFRSAHWTSGRG